jgi:hypothetical protein
MRLKRSEKINWRLISVLSVLIGAAATPIHSFAQG